MRMFTSRASFLPLLRNSVFKKKIELVNTEAKPKVPDWGI